MCIFSVCFFLPSCSFLLGLIIFCVMIYSLSFVLVVCYNMFAILSCSDHPLNTQGVSKHSFLEAGAASLLVEDMEAKMKGQLWRIFGTVGMPYFDKLLQTSLLTTTNTASALSHIRAITASKRSKTASSQIWHVLLT